MARVRVVDGFEPSEVSRVVDGFEPSDVLVARVRASSLFSGEVRGPGGVRAEYVRWRCLANVRGGVRAERVA